MILPIDTNNIGLVAKENVACENKGVDQPAHPRRLISAFVIHSQESIVAKFVSRNILIS